MTGRSATMLAHTVAPSRSSLTGPGCRHTRATSALHSARDFSISASLPRPLRRRSSALRPRMISVSGKPYRKPPPWTTPSTSWTPIPRGCRSVFIAWRLIRQRRGLEATGPLPALIWIQRGVRSRRSAHGLERFASVMDARRSAHDLNGLLPRMVSPLRASHSLDATSAPGGEMIHEHPSSQGDCASIRSPFTITESISRTDSVSFHLKRTTSARRPGSSVPRSSRQPSRRAGFSVAILSA